MTDETGPEVFLWRAVVVRALEDACYVVRKTGNAKTKWYSPAAGEQREARDWLIGNGRDFREVCTLAGLDPDAVHERAVAMKGRGWKMRKAQIHPSRMAA